MFAHPKSKNKPFNFTVVIVTLLVFVVVIGVERVWLEYAGTNIFSKAGETKHLVKSEIKPITKNETKLSENDFKPNTTVSKPSEDGAKLMHLDDSFESSDASKLNNTIHNATVTRTQPLPASHLFPGNALKSFGCVKKDRINAISKAVEELNNDHKIRVFPRNGFLLGIIRHGGFLPNEEIDADFGVMFTDVENLLVNRNNKVGNFIINPMPTESYWVNWNGINPISGKPYPFFNLKISRSSFSETAASFYPYRYNNTFYPRPNVKDFNYEGNAKEMQRWNLEGANFRLVDTDELVNMTNFAIGKQIGTVFSSKLDCMVEKQFYFTHILVPCDFEKILNSQYGRNWRRIERRSKWESLVVSEADQTHFLNHGPLPMCESE